MDVHVLDVVPTGPMDGADGLLRKFVQNVGPGDRVLGLRQMGAPGFVLCRVVNPLLRADGRLFVIPTTRPVPTSSARSVCRA